MLDVAEAVRSLWAVPEAAPAEQSLYRFLTKSLAALLQVRHLCEARPCTKTFSALSSS